MSGPYRWQPESARSPLDRRPQNPPPTQPVSFKTNVNRMKTKKWVEAKKNAYDGDDWGDYDEYDEYGASEQEPPPPAQHAAPQARGYGQRFDQPGRSFTDPQRQGPPPSGRRNSFEAGEEQRAFSASTGQPLQGFPGHQDFHPQEAAPSQPYVHPALRQTSGAHSDTSDTPEHRRNFSPSAMPPPLNTRMSTGPGSATGSPSTQFPPRKSSIGHADSPVATSPRDRAPSNPGKPLPFIRPADIYRRAEEEKQRGRASLDEQRLNVAGAPEPNAANDQQPALPPVKEGTSTADIDFRSVVDQAFAHADDQRSVPPTPISKSDSGVSRSNTDSTSGISPIMSRVPSSATHALRARNLAGGDGSTPIIAEEASESSTPVSRPTSVALLSGTHQIPRKASPSHSRNVSSSSLPGSGLATPNASGSPARSPVINPQAQVPGPEAAELSSLGHPQAETTVALPADATVREADIAEAMRFSPVEAHPELSAAEKESQTAFLESHQASTTMAEAVPRSRSESPSKGRVQELAGKFGDVSHSRRGSTQSNASRTSLQSWERSGENSRSASPTKSASPSRDSFHARPAAERESSFRPKLPGQWESYATSAASPSKELSSEHLPATNNTVSSPLGEVDLTPTTAKHSVALVEPSKADTGSSGNPLTDSLAALKAAGAAMGEAVQSSIGLGSSPTDEAHREQTHGSVLPRPLQLYREDSSVSTIPPTPPAKDTPDSEEMPPPPPLKEKSPEPRSASTSSVPPARPVMLPQLSTDMADGDQESDRLRKEIVASLSPQPTATGSNTELNTAALHAGGGHVNRESSLFSSEYESYLADGDRTSTRPSHDQSQHGGVQIHSDLGKSITADPLTQSPSVATKPSIQTRFSWEDGGSGLLINKLQQTPTAMDPEDVKRAETEEKIPLPAVERAGEEHGVDGFPDSYFGPTHGVTAVKPEPISDADLNVRSPTVDLASPADSLTQTETDRATSPPTGLHVVNSALNPEAVDLPPRLSREVSPVSEQARPSHDMPTKDSLTVNHDPAQGPIPNPAISAPLHGSQESAATSPIATASPTSDKPLGFKDIAQIKSTAERISNYNKTREHWAHADHGLGDWVSTALSANPDLATQPYPQPKPNLNTSGTMRHRPTGSISLFGKHHGANSSQAESASGSQTPATPTSAPTLQGSGRSASHQMQAKGKDLLHTAGLLSGKGMTGAKGLFAKGKSRFKSDKATTSESEPSSREASEEPSDIGSAASDSLVRISLDTTEGFVEEKRHKRCFSSPFHRSSRSRSRPSSIILPSIEYTPRSTPGNSRPQSYHPPEAWSAGPSALSGTPPVAELQTPTPEHLGVLPSPAKSAFSWMGLEHEGNVPPVPKIPDDIEEHGGSVSHRLLQSVIRNSTPPVCEMETLDQSPTFKVEPPSSRDQIDDVSAGHQEVPSDAPRAFLKNELARAEEQIVEPQIIVHLHQQKDSEEGTTTELFEDAVRPTTGGHQQPGNEGGTWQAMGIPVASIELSSQPDGTVMEQNERSPPLGQGELNSARAATQPFLDDDKSDDDLPPQLHHDPVSPKVNPMIFEEHFGTVGAEQYSGFETVSPVLSSAKSHRLSGTDREASGQLHPHQHPSNQLRQTFSDVSPMITPTKLASEIPDDFDDEQLTPIARGRGERGEGRFSYETELIGGDLSPVSSHAFNDEEKTPTKIDTRSSPTVDKHANQVIVRVIEAAPSRDQAAAGEALKATPRPLPHQQLSAYRVVHAVEYLHSQSSFESWEQESVAAQSQSDDSPHIDQQDEAELQPVPTSSLLQREEAQTEGEIKASSPAEKTILMPAPSSPTPAVPIKSDTPQEGPQQSPDFARPGPHKRSESLISKISSMVSADDASVSPISSYGPRSRPPSRVRAQERNIPSAKTSPIPVQIKEEPDPSDRTINSTIDNDDFDLYADHNGVVKDIQDEEGRPLRVATDQPPKSPALSRPPTSSASKSTPLSAPMEEGLGRYSDERPMSFVWGPRDANGRPQDEINRPGGGNMDPPPPIPPLPNTRVQRSSQVPNGPNSNKKMQKPRALSIGHLLEQPSQGGLGSKNVSPLSSYRESNKTSPHSNVSQPPTSNVSPPPQRSPPLSSSERSLRESLKITNGYQEPVSPPKSPDPRLLQDPRVMMEAQMRGWVPGQPLPQETRSRAQLPGQGPQMAGNMLSAARNQYEFQQMMARQAMQTPEFKPSSASAQPTKKEDKFTIPKLSTVFKGLGKSSSSIPQVSQAPAQPTQQQMQQFQNRGHPPTGTVPENARRSASLQSGVSDLSSAQMAPPKERRSSGLGSALNRPPSLGQESHISQDSTRVQVTDSRLDLRFPANPPPNQGIPPQLPPQQVLQNIPNLPRPQDHRVPTSSVPETGGKKKRFSALGNIFNRSSTIGSALPSKTKMSKEEKKAQKAQKHSSATPLRSVPQGQPWPPQQPVGPNQYGNIQYGPPPMARPFPGMQGVLLQPMQLQAIQQHAMLPPPPQSMQQQTVPPIPPQVMHPHGLPQQYMQPTQGFQQPHQMAPVLPIQSQQPPGVPEGSAYIDTRHIAQTMLAQRIQEQSRLPTQPPSHMSRADAPSAPESFYHHVPQTGGHTSPPVNEYSKPDLGMIKPLPPIQQQQQQQQQQQPVRQYQHHERPPQQQAPPIMASQQPPNTRSVSAPVPVPSATPPSHLSQWQGSSPLEEPRYETPPIPGAYTHVSGAFVSPQSEEPPSQVDETRDRQPYNRQSSDPQMQPISPQVSAMTTSGPNVRHNSNDSVVSPIVNTSPGSLIGNSPPSTSKPQKQRMSSISEQSQSERLWNLDLPHGATEQDIVRARQRQYMEQQLLAQEQLHAERTGRSPSPRSGHSNQSTTPPPPPTQERPPRRQSGGFRELLPRGSPQPYAVTNQQTNDRLIPQRPHSPSPPIAPAPVHPGSTPSPAAYPLPISPDPLSVTSPVNPTANMMPPPPLPDKVPHTPLNAAFPNSHMSRPISQDAASDHTHDSLYDPPPPPTEEYQHPAHRQQPEYEDLPPADEPPPYSGPGVPNEGMDKDRPRPPNIVTDASDRGRLPEPRQRQASLGILQHPQPASMAASPQRSSADMGADILRRQLLEVEERERQERIQRAELQRQETARERQERERARARARELERSVSGGGRVPSLRAPGSTRTSANGFERSGGTARLVYELPAEDDEPVMRATSFPGQEWVPTWTGED